MPLIRHVLAVYDRQCSRGDFGRTLVSDSDGLLGDPCCFHVGTVLYYLWFWSSRVLSGLCLAKRQKPVTQFVAFSLIAAVFEYVCSWVLEYGLHMKAWGYRRHFLNIGGEGKP